MVYLTSWRRVGPSSKNRTYHDWSVWDTSLAPIQQCTYFEIEKRKKFWNCHRVGPQDGSFVLCLNTKGLLRLREKKKRIYLPVVSCEICEIGQF